MEISERPENLQIRLIEIDAEMERLHREREKIRLELETRQWVSNFENGKENPLRGAVFV